MVLVGITGGSASGKSTLADAIARALGPRGLHLRQDDYYLPIPEGVAAKDHNFDEPAAFDNPRLVDHLDDLRRGLPIDRPIYDFDGRGPSGSVQEAPRPVVVLEGLFLLAVPEISERLDVRVFVRADPEVRLARRMARDQAARNWSAAQISERFWGTVEPGQIRWIDPSSAWADLVLVNHHPDVASFLAAEKAPLLERIERAAAGA